MKDSNFKTNRPLALVILGNTLLMILSQTAIRETEIGQFFRGALAGFIVVTFLIAFWDMKHETTVSEWKKSLFAGLKK